MKTISQILNSRDGEKLPTVTGTLSASPIEHLGGNNTEAQRFTLSDPTGSISCTMWKPSFSKLDLTRLNGETVTISATGQYGDITVKEFRGTPSLNVGNKVSIHADAPPHAGGVPAPQPPTTVVSTPPPVQSAPTASPLPVPAPTDAINRLCDLISSQRLARVSEKTDVQHALNTSLEWIGNIKLVAESLAFEQNSNMEKTAAASQIYSAVFQAVFGGKLVQGNG